MEAQRYPADFDAIVAGSPGLNWSGRAAQSVWVAQMNKKDDAHTLPQAKFAVVHQAALDACDALDGVKDGVIGNPRKCKFNPEVMVCKDGDAPNCLTAAQIETVRRIYSDVTNSKTHESYFPGHEPGSEMGWNTMAGAQPFGPGVDLFKYVVYQKADWDYKTFDFDKDMEMTRKASAAMDAMDTNLKPFFDRGGKLIQYHGWADPQISPRSSVEYYDGVAKRLANKLDNYKLFLIPGMAHCGGGDGTSSFDMLDTMQRWVEKKQAPASVAAARVRNGQTDRTRPLCPYPQEAVYSGTGSTDEAANFSCKVP
jgi:feruloyl esterase